MRVVPVRPQSCITAVSYPERPIHEHATRGNQAIEHQLFMITLKADPIPTFATAACEAIDDLPTARPSVDIITEENHRTRRGTATYGCQCSLQEIRPPVQITYSERKRH